MHVDEIRKNIIAHVAASAFKITPRHLVKSITENYSLDRPCAIALLKDLVAQGELEYTYEFGSTYLVPSFNRPVRISTHVVIMPPGHQYRSAPGDAIVRIMPGAAFGGGRHPTTRLAVRGIEYLLRDCGPMPTDSGSCALDIGTGSGILVLAAVHLGIQKGFGIDIDPIARMEARQNVRINDLANRIEIGGCPLASIRRRFCMVTANLRLPGLQRWCRKLARLTLPNGFLVFSGVRMHEVEGLLDSYAAQNCHRLWQAEEQGWCGLVLQRSA